MNNYKVYRHISPSGKVYIGITKCELEKDGKMVKAMNIIQYLVML